jgi:lipopolysaccharide transport system ATP-binding protein
MEPIIKVENLGKSYIIGHQRERYVALRDVLANKARQVASKTKNIFSGGQLIAGNELEEFWALKDINFEVTQGDRVGIIGRNGAGKSTLLKVLSRITEPTTGKIHLKGRVASLLEVGTGFHPELSGRENIYLNGAILGMSRVEVKKKFDEIVDFAGVEKFLDTPVKRYSSGMYVRLAFAVAAHLEPEILIIDEVLAVGDAEFQKKCLGKMEDVSKNEGRTVLFVSHNMAAIKNLCSTTLWLNQGSINKVGETNTIIEEYNKSAISIFTNSERIFEPDPQKLFQILSIRVIDSLGNLKTVFECDEDIYVELKCISREMVPGLYGWFDLRNAESTIVIVSDTFDYLPNCLDSLPKGEYIFRLKVPSRTIGHGKYTITLSFTSPQNINNFYLETLNEICSFEVSDNNTTRGNSRPGYLSTLISWEKINL